MRRGSLSPLRSLFFAPNQAPFEPHCYYKAHHLHSSRSRILPFSSLAKLSPNSTIRENYFLGSFLRSPSVIYSRFLSTRRVEEDGISDETDDQDWWEEEETTDPVMGDGGDGGGVALGNVSWGERALEVARDILSEHFSDDVALFAFKVSPKGYVYVRLDRLTDKYGCPDIKEIQKFNNVYKEKLDEIIAKGEIALDLAIEVSSPGAERLVKVPEDLDRFKDMPMNVQYIEEDSSGRQEEMERVLLLESIDDETRVCVWKLADVKENREEGGKGRPLNRKQKDWRLCVPFGLIKRVMLYLYSKH